MMYFTKPYYEIRKHIIKMMCFCFFGCAYGTVLLFNQSFFEFSSKQNIGNSLLWIFSILFLFIAWMILPIFPHKSIFARFTIRSKTSFTRTTFSHIFRILRVFTFSTNKFHIYKYNKCVSVKQENNVSVKHIMVKGGLSWQS